MTQIKPGQVWEEAVSVAERVRFTVRDVIGEFAEVVEDRTHYYPFHRMLPTDVILRNSKRFRLISEPAIIQAGQVWEERLDDTEWITIMVKSVFGNEVEVLDNRVWLYPHGRTIRLQEILRSPDRFRLISEATDGE
jgi:hypothetical protein